MPETETVALLKSLDHQVRDLDHQVKGLDHQVKGLDHQVKDLDHQVKNLDHRVENLDHRVVNIEQLLPTLATKADLERYATKEDLREGLREEGERSRLYMKVLVEDLRDTVNRALDGNIVHTQRLDEHGVRLDGHDAKKDGLDQRVTATERARPRSR